MNPATSTPAESGTPAKPEDVRTAFHLWWAVVALGVLRLILGAADNLLNRHRIAQDFHDQLQDQQGQFGLTQMELAVTILEILILAYGLGVAVGAAAVVRHIDLGRLWARTVGDIAAVVLVFGAIGSLLGLGTVSGGMTVLIGAVSILQAVLACGAVFLCRRSESAKYFRAGGH